jgi:Zn finger protein HypA/HybF involved in hydrogenase expression
MGETNVFKCEKCSYRAEVSGGRDSGKLVATDTRMCPNCLRIVDAVTKIVCSPELAAQFKLDLAKTKGRCPRCGNFKLLPWKAKACPKCGGKMKKAGDGPVCMWD